MFKNSLSEVSRTMAPTMQSFVAIIIAINMVSSSYNLIFNDNSVYGTLYLWGMNITTNMTTDCCVGDVIYKDDHVPYNMVCMYYTNYNGTLICQDRSGISANTNIMRINSTINYTNTAENIHISPESYIVSYQALLHYPDAYHRSPGCNITTADTIGLWGTQTPPTMFYGCIDSNTQNIQAIDSYPTDQNYIIDFHALGALYDAKRDLLWSYGTSDTAGPNFISSIHPNGTDYKNFSIPVGFRNGIFMDCHYSEYYDIYPCLCKESKSAFGYYDPKTNTSHLILDFPIDQNDYIQTWALIDNGQYAIFFGDKFAVYAMDVMDNDNLAFKQIGTIHLPDYPSSPYVGALANLLSFTG